ncbi:MAG: hypothetical protein GX101_03285 [Firmicutes bacterium]|jgi:DNA gyrase subunit B|nr:hypothetical protein [Bacillota bacterium]NLO65695.1 hypothetical protein [Bacillota bacterium]
MTRDYGQEIDQLREELREIKEMLRPKEEDPRTLIQKIPDMHPDPHIQQILSQLEDTCEEKNQNGAITYLGVYASGGRQSTWIRHQVNADDLLKLIENRMAEKVLTSIGNNDRLNMLLQILRKPMTVAQLVEEGDYNSTGQVYHHLKPLIAADLIVEDPNSETRGTYIVQPHRVQGIIMLLAGISDMLDPSFTKGEWHE